MAFRRFTHASKHFSTGAHFEHWYRDKTVYFITASVREHFPAFRSDAAKAIFWDRFDDHANKCGYEPWVTSLLDTHYHTLGYFAVGKNLGVFMQRLHGSVAKLVNDTLPARHRPFFRERGKRDYFDGCLRDEHQYRRAYRYTILQSVRHGVCRDWRAYPHTRIAVELEAGARFALQNKAFMEGIRYKRYDG